MATIRVRYIGPHDEVEVPLGDGTAVTVQRNHQAEVPAEIAGNSKHGLLEQEANWEKVEPAARATRDEAPAKDAAKDSKGGGE